MAGISKIIEVLLFLQVLYEGSYSQENCDPYTKCALNDPGYQVIDPKDCHNYYICVKDASGNVVPTDHVYECASGSYFRESYQQCYSGSCTNNCLNKCPLECTDYEYERIADPDDCTIFYTCRPAQLKVKSQCPSDSPYFDGAACSESPFSCCDSCSPWCDQTYTEVLDPFDCRSFYMCTTTTGPPTESSKYKCPESEFFDPSLGVCTYEDSTSPCASLCTNKTSTETPINQF